MGVCHALAPDELAKDPLVESNEGFLFARSEESLWLFLIEASNNLYASIYQAEDEMLRKFIQKMCRGYLLEAIVN